MARLDMKNRTSIGAQLSSRLPGHWRVVVGAEGCAFIEVDQDGKKPAHEFHAIGSAVIRLENAGGGKVSADRYERVKFPPGYAEGRKHHSEVAQVNGRGWTGKLVEAVTTAAMEADAQLSGAAAAEA